MNENFDLFRTHYSASGWVALSILIPAGVILATNWFVRMRLGARVRRLKRNIVRLEKELADTRATASRRAIERLAPRPSQSGDGVEEHVQITHEEKDPVTTIARVVEEIKAAAEVRKMVAAAAKDDGNAETIFDYRHVTREMRERLEFQAAPTIKAAHGRLVDDLATIGGELEEAKGLLSDADFVAWLEAEFGWSKQTASDLASFAEHFASNPRAARGSG